MVVECYLGTIAISTKVPVPIVVQISVILAHKIITSSGLAHAVSPIDQTPRSSLQS